MVPSARVSTRNQRPDLLNHVVALAPYCQQHGIIPTDTMPGHRQWLELSPEGLNQLFHDMEVGQGRPVIVAHKDRPVRFGFE